MIIFDIVILLILFGILGYAADFIVENIKYLAKTLKIRLFAFGILLGIITTLPELSVGINATLNKVGGLSFGNILGGVIVMLGLILGTSLILNRKITTDGDLKKILPQLGIIIIPIILGLDGVISRFDGLIMIIAYFGLIYYLYKTQNQTANKVTIAIDKNKIIKAIFFSIIGIVIVLLSSNWIVQVTLNLLQYLHLSEMAVGLLIFSIGTNLPEISITFTSWRKKTAELSLSHLLSSAFTNIFVLGILASLYPIAITIGLSYFILGMFIIITLGIFAVFYYTEKKLDRNEGLALVICYACFIIANIWVLGQ
jgi:cation:H+ antiporter